MKHNPAFYQIAAKFGGTSKSRLRNFAKNISNKDDERVAPDLVPHPLYIELQKQSPMGMMRDYELTIIDEASGITTMEFY